jgi:glycosyltransferase involved in cell wall biosynthesis
LGRSPALAYWLEKQVASATVDVIHNHSLWMMPNVYPGRVCRRHANCRLVVSPRGTLSQWALRANAIAKRMFWRVVQGPAVRESSCLHATAESEYEDIRRIGLRQPVCVLPNGIDVPPLQKPDQKGRRCLLFLGRIHPKKGVDVLLRAWSAVEGRFGDWELRVVGPDNGGCLESIQDLASRLNVRRAFFPGPLYGGEKLQAYRQASLFVLPTHSENFGMTVAEALAAGTPAIVTAGAPWSGLSAEGAGWWIEDGVDALVSCLEEALAASDERLLRMGAAGRRWMIRDFNWPRIAERFVGTYRWLLCGGEVPPWVKLN